MKPTARQTNDEVAWASAIAVDDAISLDNSDAKACEVIIARGIKIRKNCGFSACKCAARINATVTNSLDKGSCKFNIVLGHGKVIKKDDGLCTCAKAIIDRHSDKIDANGVIFLHHGCNFKLGTYSIVAGYENGMFIIAGEKAIVEIETKKAGKSTKPTHYPGSVSSLDQRRHGVDCLLVQFQVKPRRLVIHRRFVIRTLGHDVSLPNFDALIPIGMI